MTAIPPPTPKQSGPEFSHIVPLSDIGSRIVHFRLEADEAQRMALARRFALRTLDAFTGEIDLCSDDAGLVAKGTISAKLSQACVISGAAVPADLSEPFTVRFVAESSYEADAEIELDAAECDTMFHDGRGVDLGELLAQTLGLAINPYPRSPDAEAVLKAAGVKAEGEADDEFGPFAALAALRKDVG